VSGLPAVNLRFLHPPMVSEVEPEGGTFSTANLHGGLAGLPAAVHLLAEAVQSPSHCPQHCQREVTRTSLPAQNLKNSR